MSDRVLSVVVPGADAVASTAADDVHINVCWCDYQCPIFVPERQCCCYDGCEKVHCQPCDRRC